MVQSAPELNEWERPERAEAPRGKILVALVFVAWVTPVAVAAVMTGGLFIWLAIAIFSVTVVFVAGQRHFMSAGTVPATEHDHPRLVNIARGLAGDLAIPVPRLLVSKKPGPNAFVAPGALAVTHDLLAAYTRTELEAVIAHCLVRLRDGGLGWALAASAIRGGERWATPRVDPALDARTVAVTRYPPALASAIRKATPASGARASFWFVADARSHAPVEQRALELDDL